MPSRMGYKMAIPCIYVGFPVYTNWRGEPEENQLTGVIAYSQEEAKKTIIEHLSRRYSTGSQGWSVEPVLIKSSVSLEDTVEILSQLVKFPEFNLKDNNIF